MPILLDRSPFPADPSHVIFRGESVRIRADQIIVWASLTLRRNSTSAYSSATPFPVILDTRHSHTFSIQVRHLIEWAELEPEKMAVLGVVRHLRQRIQLHAANIWIHPSATGERETLAEIPPYGIRAPLGIAVFPNDFPRLPILGLRALAENNLVLKIDGPKRQATLRTPSKWWPFA